MTILVSAVMLQCPPTPDNLTARWMTCIPAHMRNAISDNMLFEQVFVKDGQRTGDYQRSYPVALYL